jgi:hypothetical protein
VFPVEKSYSFGGEIIDVATSYLPISATQIEQFPLTVFTTSGIYAIQQGEGDTLYGKVAPLQPIVIDKKATSVPQGTFFSSSNNLYLMVGREAVNVSQALTGRLELGIRDSESYRALCMSNGGVNDFSKTLSSVDFEEFIADATMVYDQLNNEIIISNKTHMYSYVFNIGTREYHKVPKRYLPAPSNARYVLEVTGDTTRLVDMHSETRSDSKEILIQSRPMSLEALYTHIDRLILLADADLDDSCGNNLCLSVFASDNLNDWKCIISAQKHDSVFRQIRTNRAAKSYRDYIFVINGNVSTDTDISDIIADYTVVSRRLG